jgi:hypothetical protein
MIDVVHEISAVQRQVGSRVLDAGEARIVTVIRTYGAPVEDVWDACTNPGAFRVGSCPSRVSCRSAVATSSRAMRAGGSSVATHPRASSPPGSTAGRSAGSNSGSHRRRAGSSCPSAARSGAAPASRPAPAELRHKQRQTALRRPTRQPTPAGRPHPDKRHPTMEPGNRSGSRAVTRRRYRGP